MYPETIRTSNVILITLSFCFSFICHAAIYSSSSPNFRWYSSTYLFTRSFLCTSFNNPDSDWMSVGESFPCFSIYSSTSNAEEFFKISGRLRRKIICLRSSGTRCSESSAISFLYSLANQPTFARGGKGLVNVLYSFCNFGM